MQNTTGVPLLAGHSNFEGKLSTERDYSWVGFAFLTALCIGSVNFFHGELSAKFGIAGSYPLFFSIVVMWVVYYTVVYFQNSFMESRGEVAPRSVYRREDGGLNWAAVLGIVIRGVNHGCLICITFLSLEYASLANVNVGVIASLFTSGVVFTAILFYFVYGE